MRKPKKIKRRRIRLWLSKDITRILFAGQNTHRLKHKERVRVRFYDIPISRVMPCPVCGEPPTIEVRLLEHFNTKIHCHGYRVCGIAPEGAVELWNSICTKELERNEKNGGKNEG